MLQEDGIQKSRARTCCTMLSRGIVHAPRDFSIVGFHVLALHKDSKIRCCMFNKSDLYNFSFDSFSTNLIHFDYGSQSDYDQTR